MAGRMLRLAPHLRSRASRRPPSSPTCCGRAAAPSAAPPAPLETAGFVRRSRRRGDRREYFSVPPGAIHALVAGAGAIYRRLEVIAAHGIGVVADLPPPKRERIQEFHDFVAYVERLRPGHARAVPPGPGRGPCSDRRRASPHRVRLGRHAPSPPLPPERHQPCQSSGPNDSPSRTASTAASSTSTWRSRPGRSSASSGPTAPARRRPSAPSSTSSGRRPGARSCSTSRRPRTRSRSTAGSATSPASSRCTTA